MFTPTDFVLMYIVLGLITMEVFVLYARRYGDEEPLTNNEDVWCLFLIGALWPLVWYGSIVDSLTKKLW